MSRSNTAFFHPNRDRVLQGIALDMLRNPATNAVEPALLLGPKERDLRDAGMYAASQGAYVLWSLDGLPLRIDDGKLVRASIMCRNEPSRGTVPYLSSNLESGTCLVLVRTGLSGNPKSCLRQARNARDSGIAPVHHGVLALTDVRCLVADYADDAGIGDAFPSLLKDGIPGRTMSLFELHEGMELLVGDIFPGRECLLAVRNGQVERRDAPVRAAELMRQAFACTSRIAA